LEKSALNLSETKQGKIRTMFFTVKMLALFFSAIPLFQYFSENFSMGFNNNNYNILYSVGITLISICLLMLFLMFIFQRNENDIILQKLEMAIFVIVFIFAIYVSGANESYNKFIFLFIIISYTIEYGMKTGLVIASISSGVIILMDFAFGGGHRVNRYFEEDIALFVMFFLTAWTIGFYVRLEKSHIEYLIEHANIDGLTGAYNHRYFHEIIGKIWEESMEKKEVLSLLMIDIDYFKKYNDTFGHKRGDELLRQVSAVFKKNLRKTDILCRYGGDEFCVILTDTDKEQATVIANHLRQAVSRHQYKGDKNLSNEGLTISVGVSTFNGELEDYNGFIENADIALYRAKFLRRNRVEVYSSVFNDIEEIDNMNADLLENLKPLKTLITVINSRDSYTFKHVDRVFKYCLLVADAFELSLEDKRMLLYAAYLHDLGKINVAKETLIEDKKLTQQQWEELKQHPKDSEDMLRQIHGFEDVATIVLQHHEKYDGTGYPYGLRGEDINYLARILTVVDSFDAMTNLRPYQKTKTFEEALKEIKRCRGTHFDADIADKFIETINSL